jgi:hypothetical protein
MWTEHHKTPIAMYELSCEVAIQCGYWTGNAGDPLLATDNFLLYGVDTDAPLSPVDEVATDPESLHEEPIGSDAEKEAGIFLNEDAELQEVCSLMDGFDFDEDDGNWGIEVYCKAVILLVSLVSDA